MEPIELSVVVPCSNGASTIGARIGRLRSEMTNVGLVGEVIVADRGSTDGTQQIALQSGARVVHIGAPGYGAALRGGTLAARGTAVLVIDELFDEADLPRFVERLIDGDQLVVGHRAPGGSIITRLHLRLRNWIGGRGTRTTLTDVSCEVRAFDRQAVLGLDLRVTGPELTTEMVLHASRAGMQIGQAPVAGRGTEGPSLALLLASSAWRWPGVVAAIMVALGFLGIIFSTGERAGLVGACLLVLVGVQLATLPVLARATGVSSGLVSRPPRSTTDQMGSPRQWRNVGLLALLIGGGALVGAALTPNEAVPFMIPGGTALAVGLQLVLTGLLVRLAELRVDRAAVRIHEVTTAEGRAAHRTIA
jgi:hypothetical protein